MANYQYSSDIIEAALFHAGEHIDGSSDYDTAALRYLNDIYQQIYLGGSGLVPDMQEDWWWLNATSTIFLLPSYATGTINLTQGSASATLSTSPTISLANYFLIIENHDDPYQITAHTASTDAVTLDQTWRPGSDTAAEFKAVLTDYDLPSDLLRLLYPLEVHRGRYPHIEGVSRAELTERWPLNNIGSGVPEVFAMIDDNTMRFNRYGNKEGEEEIRVEIPYLQRPSALTDSGSEEPLVPLEYRSILTDFISGQIMLDKNDDRADGKFLAAKARLTAMAEENRRRWKNMRRNVGSIGYRPRQINNNRLQTSSGVYIYPRTY